MDVRLSTPAHRSRGIPRRAAAVLAAASAAVGMGVVSHGVVAHADDSIYECGQYNGGHQVALLVNHNSGAVTAYPTTGGDSTTASIQAAIGAAQADVTKPTSSGSGAGDTVIVCQGTYRGNLTIGAGNDNLTVRSEEGPNNATIVGNGSAPVVTIDDRGLSFGGPAEGFTIRVANTSGSTNLTAIQLGVPGAQSTANEDEQCAAAGTPVSTASGCDQAAPADVTINDQVIDNIVTGFSGLSSADSITGIKLDNTINSVVQQNLFTNVVPDHTTIAGFSGIVVGGFNESAPSPAPTGYTTGDSTNINAALFQNALVNVFQGGNSRCATGGNIEGLGLNGFLLDAQVYNNWLQQLDQNGLCAVVGLSSNAYGSLENEQTGTLAPVNANIDNNTFSQLGIANATNTTAIYLAPTPASATPSPQPAPTGCVPQANQNCQDSYPPSSYTVVDNEIQQVYRAVDDEAVLGSNSFIRFNNFDNDNIGVQNGAAAGTANTSLDATNNWWGCELQGASAPPSTPTTNNHNCAALVNTGGGVTSWAPAQTARVEQAGDEAGDNAGQS